MSAWLCGLRGRYRHTAASEEKSADRSRQRRNCRCGGTELWKYDSGSPGGRSTERCDDRNEWRNGYGQHSANVWGVCGKDRRLCGSDCLAEPAYVLYEDVQDRQPKSDGES